MTDRTFTLIWAVLAVVMGTSLIVFTKSTVRSALKWQRQNPDAPHPQWVYPFTRGIGWLFVLLGIVMGGAQIAGALA
ncbi:hypothetical protein ACQEVI_09120 [Promicromonospora sp. CA-289599]|uniref:hypothetical protein n=1 Tax=Promicromonospora sp. CA-289599 TaxID=3240014 RepID=UPI003D93B2D9